MKAIAETLDVSRSNLIEHCKKVTPSSPAKKASVLDEEVLERIRRITNERATYGYPRVTAVLRKELKNEGKAPVNHKRVNRIMKENDLCLTRHKGKRTLNHDDKVITLRPNLRWCTDIFQIQCWNGDLVRVLFSLDCCDRDAMRFFATSEGIDVSRVRDLMTETLESRFGNVKTDPHRVE